MSQYVAMQPHDAVPVYTHNSNLAHHRVVGASDQITEGRGFKSHLGLAFFSEATYFLEFHNICCCCNEQQERLFHFCVLYLQIKGKELKISSCLCCLPSAVNVMLNLSNVKLPGGGRALVEDLNSDQFFCSHARLQEKSINSSLQEHYCWSKELN